MIAEADLSAWIEKCWPDPTERPPWSRGVYRDLLESEQRQLAHQHARSVEGQRIERLERTVAQQEKQIAKLEKRLAPIAKWFAPIGEGDDPDLPAIMDVIARALAVVRKEVRGRDRFCGLWRPERAYDAHDEVVHNGARWHATKAIDAGTKPGAGETGWQLTHKSETALVRRLVREEMHKERNA